MDKDKDKDKDIDIDIDKANIEIEAATFRKILAHLNLRLWSLMFHATQKLFL